MSAISETVRLFAEEHDAVLPQPKLPEDRIMTPEYCLYLAATPTQTHVTRVRTTEERLDHTLADIRGQIRTRGYRGATWSIGPSCRPRGLVELLMSRGFVPATTPPAEPSSVAMALTHPPSPAPSDVEARHVQSYDEYLVALGIAMKAFEIPPDGVAGWRAAAPELYKQQDGVDRLTMLGFVDGRPAGFGWAAAGRDGLVLCGSGVLPESRGRGVYRALVEARWRAAVELGKPALVIHAGAMSLPVLERCGFERICRMDVLTDPEIR